MPRNKKDLLRDIIMFDAAPAALYGWLLYTWINHLIQNATDMPAGEIARYGCGTVGAAGMLAYLVYHRVKSIKERE